MKASELKPGQFFEFVDHRERYRALAARDEHRRFYTDKDWNMSWCAKDLEVTPLAVAGWDDGETGEPMIDGIRVMPAQSPRVETGPLQFGNDWPGVFIRGDNAAYYALNIEAVLNGMKGIPRVVVNDLVASLRSCQVMSTNPPSAESATKPSDAPFVAGDWVVVLTGEGTGNTIKDGELCQIEYTSGWCHKLVGKTDFWNKSRFRLATQEEIAEARIANGK